MKNIMKIGVWGIIIFLLGACTDIEKEDKTNKSLKIKSSSDNKCKEFAIVEKSSRIIAPDRTCVEYQYNKDNTLSLKHINAGFNCDSGKLFATVNKKENTIVIEEHETQNGAKCLCLYDLEIEIEGLAEGEYEIKFIEPYVGKQQELIFKINLRKGVSGSFCVKRNEYPWKKS